MLQVKESNFKKYGNKYIHKVKNWEFEITLYNCGFTTNIEIRNNKCRGFYFGISTDEIENIQSAVDFINEYLKQLAEEVEG